MKYIKVIIDTNALLYCFKYKINIESELTGLIGSHNLLILKCVYNELKNLAGKKSEAKSSLNWIKKFQITETEGKGDDCILETAKKMNTMVITNDTELKKRLKTEQIKVIYIRKKAYLVLDGE